VPVLVGASVYGATALALGLEEARVLWSALCRRAARLRV
jgi:hypothetical protein